MKLEMLLKDLIRTVRLKRSRSILREAFKNGKEENFDDAWQTQILKRILKRNQYTQDSIGTKDGLGPLLHALVELGEQVKPSMSLLVTLT